MDKMEKCRPDDSIIWATWSWLKTCSPRVLKEGGRKASGGPAKRRCRCVSLLFITVWTQTPKGVMLIKAIEDTKLGEITNMMKSRLKS